MVAEILFLLHYPLPHSYSPMSLIQGNHLSQGRFASLPEIGNIPGFSQAKASLKASSTVSSISTKCDNRLQEGDLITGTINVAHERAHMVPAVRNPHAHPMRRWNDFSLYLDICFFTLKPEVCLCKLIFRKIELVL